MLRSSSTLRVHPEDPQLFMGSPACVRQGYLNQAMFMMARLTTVQSEEMRRETCHSLHEFPLAFPRASAVERNNL